MNNHLKPLIKWSGGKGDEIIQFEEHFPNDFNLYIEPFIGGGSVYFHINPNRAVIADVHSELIDFYSEIKNGNMDKIYKFMTKNENNEETYYKIRDEMSIKNTLDNAMRFYYLRKTCYRGMLRYNKQGKFNIPFGRYKTMNFELLKNKEYEKLLKNTKIEKMIFQKYSKNIMMKTILYF